LDWQAEARQSESQFRRNKVKAIDLQYVKDTLLELDPTLKNCEASDAYNRAIVLLAALTYGPGAMRLAEFTRLPYELVATIRQRMVRAELWTEDEVCCDHWEAAAGVVSTCAFWADVLVAEGLVVRQWDPDSGDYRYFDARHDPSKRKSPARANCVCQPEERS
jgi:hypothetical protein